MFHMQLVHSGLNIQFEIFTMRPFSSSLKFCRFSANFILQHSCTIPSYQVFVDKDKMPVCLSARIGIPPVCRPNPCDPQPLIKIINTLIVDTYLYMYSKSNEYSGCHQEG